MIENAIGASANHTLQCWGKGGRSELMRRVDKGDRRSVARSVLVKMLHFFSGRMDLAPVPHVQSTKVGYHAID
jgi:hypothetical protein